MTKMPKLMLGLACATVLVLGACGGDDDKDDATDTTGDDTSDNASGDAGSQDAVTYEVDALKYNDVSAPAGGTIEIVNSSGAQHTFTADDGSFDFSYGADENAFIEVPDEAGEYPFHCEIHSSMKATLTAE